MQVKVKVFEDYKIQDDIIRPIGNSIIKTLNTVDVRKSLKKFLNIRNSNDAIKFAKSYGLLNDYSFYIEWESEEKDIVTITKDNITRQDNLAYFKFKNNLKNHKSLLYQIQVTPDIYIEILLNGNIYSVSYSNVAHISFSITDGDTYKTYFENIAEDARGGVVNNTVFSKLNCTVGINQAQRTSNINQVFSKRIYTVNSFLDKLYSYDKNEINADFIYGLIGEALGFENKNKNTWISYQDKLLDYAKDVKVLTDNDVSERERIEDLKCKNKNFNKQVTLDYSYKKQKDGKYVLSSNITFKSLYDALEWFIVSVGDMIKICKYCNKPFLASREDAEYCSDSCRSKAKYHRNKLKTNAPKK